MISQMRKIKLLVATFIIGLVNFSCFVAPASAAVGPGCYRSAASASGAQTSGATCPAGDTTIADGVAAGKCYHSTNGSAYTEVDCAIVTVGTAGGPSGSPSSATNTGNVSLDSDCSSATLRADNCQIIGYLVTAINLLSAVAGLAIVGSIMFAGFQYMTARDNSGQVEAAKKRIIWALVALGIFIFTYAALNWLVPGGVL